jgi:hypothetical protein
MGRYIVTTRRAARDFATSANDAVANVPGIELISADNPQMVTIEASEESANQLRNNLKDDYFVEPMISRSVE